VLRRKLQVLASVQLFEPAVVIRLLVDFLLLRRNRLLPERGFELVLETRQLPVRIVVVQEQSAQRGTKQGGTSRGQSA
jgi:hypothetical protein